MLRDVSVEEVVEFALACERQLLVWVSDAGRLGDGAAYWAAGVRNPPGKETALKGTESGAAGAMGILASRAIWPIGIEPMQRVA
jgi:hypothetical protein